MKQITINPNNEPYYSDDFIKGFECGTQRQFEADKADRPQGEWIVSCDDSICPICGKDEAEFIYGTEIWYGQGKSHYCPNCGARLKGVTSEQPNN